MRKVWHLAVRKAATPVALLVATAAVGAQATSVPPTGARVDATQPPNERWIMPDSTRFPEQSRDSTGWYTVSGERHGPSFFRKHRFPQVEYEAGERLTFDRYHTVDVMYTWLQRWARQYPDIMELYEVGRSYEGRPILQVTLTNKSTGSHLTKPAAFFEGGRHSGEVTASESTLWLLQHLLTQYGRDTRITELLDTRTVYLRVQNNPDGSNLYHHTAQRNRSTVRPHDSDRDGLVDEDPEEDLDGDGVIHQMRWQPKPGADGAPVCWETPDGRGGFRTMRPNAVQDTRDTSGRLMRTVPSDLDPTWCVATEGIDNDLDGRFNEDGVGGLDLHRNYPENWRPEPGAELTGRGQTQGGAGAFPLSEPETRAVVVWLLQHPHVSVANSMDTRVPMHLRPPSTSASAERMFPQDLRLYEYFDSIGVSLTGYTWAGDVYETYNTRTPVNPFTGDTARATPLFGHGPDFGYWYYGAIWYGDELWNGGMYEDYNGDGIRDDVDALTWDDRSNGGRGFKPWTRFAHPQLGAVEIGGFHPKFFSQNGPPEVLEEWAKNQALFNLEMALHLPRLELDAPRAERVATVGDSTTWRVTVSWTNTGKLPTALAQAQLVKIVDEDRVQLQFGDSLTAGSTPRVRITRPGRRDKVERVGWAQPGERKDVTFELVTTGTAPVTGRVRLLSTRGGERSVPFILGGSQ